MTTSLYKTLSFRAISFSKGCGGFIILFFVLKSVMYKFMDFHRLKVIRFILF